MVRTAMLEELGQDYIRTARAKGLAERTVVYRHALPNALIPVLTVLGLQFGLAALRRDRDRDDLQLARHRPAYPVGHLQPRLCSGAGMHPRHWAYLRAPSICLPMSPTPSPTPACASEPKVEFLDGVFPADNSVCGCTPDLRGHIFLNRPLVRTCSSCPCLPFAVHRRSRANEALRHADRNVAPPLLAAQAQTAMAAAGPAASADGCDSGCAAYLP